MPIQWQSVSTPVSFLVTENMAPSKWANTPIPGSVSNVVVARWSVLRLLGLAVVGHDNRRVRIALLDSYTLRRSKHAPKRVSNDNSDPVPEEQPN